jgi:molybdate transport system substrate-binding protein
MKLTRQGDLYFPGSSDYMEKAKRDGDVLANTERVIVYLAPAINVQKGNPHSIRTLKDLTRPGLNVAIANPEGVCVGAYAVEIIENEFTPKQKSAFRDNLINYTESCEKTATAISFKMADAVLGWRVFEHWDPARIETVPLPYRASATSRLPSRSSRTTVLRRRRSLTFWPGRRDRRSMPDTTTSQPPKMQHSGSAQ